MGLVLLFDCTWHAVIKWAIHPALPFSERLRRRGWVRREVCGGRGEGSFRVGCSRMESWAHPAALALIDLEICAT